MKRKELYEKLYFHEIEQRDKLNARLQFPLAIILTLIGFLGFLLRDSSQTIDLNFAGVFFWFGWLNAFISISIASYFFVRALWGNTYTFLATASENETFYQGLREAYAEESDGKKKAKRELEQHIFNSFKEHSSTNGLLNDQRSLWIFKSIKCLIIAILFSMVSFGSHYFESLGQANKAQPIEVIIKNPTSNKETTMEKKKKPTPVKNKAPVKKPAAPNPRRVIEDYQPSQSDPTMINDKKNG